MPIVPLPFFDVVPVLLFGWTVGVYRFFNGFQYEPIAVAAGVLSLMLFFVTLHYLLRSILRAQNHLAGTPATQSPALEPVPEPEYRLTYSVSLHIGGIALAVTVSGIVLLAGIHEVYWVATSDEPWIDAGSARVARRMQSSNNIKHIALGMHSYHDTYKGTLPSGTILPDGRLGHSWATQILPYAEQPNLYEKIDFDKPWTDPVNRAALETRVYVLSSPSMNHQHTAAGYAVSGYAVNERVLPVGASVTFGSITDGISNTILLGEVKGNVRAWGDPTNGRDPALGINKSPYGFGSHFPNGANIGFCDGAVLFMSNDTDMNVMRALATPNGGEEVPLL